jgi:hypothetical protein
MNRCTGADWTTLRREEAHSRLKSNFTFRLERLAVAEVITGDTFVYKINSCRSAQPLLILSGSRRNVRENASIPPLDLKVVGPPGFQLTSVFGRGP